MDYTNIKYDSLRNYIKSMYNDKKNWDAVKKLENTKGFDRKMYIDLVISDTPTYSGKLTEAMWEEMVDFLSKREEDKKIVKLGEGIKSDVEIPRDEYSAWQLYKKKLIDQNWSEESIENIERSSYEILQNLTMNTPEDGPTKGLVVGNVQSGKTANMAGLMAMAADSGFNYFIVLSGVIENLRQQTAKRLHEDMNSSGKGNLHWHKVDNPSLRHQSAETNISKFNLAPNDKDRYFTVCLKNKTRLNNLKKWLLSDVNKTKQLKVLIIDDEADQASVNTKAIEEEESTAINNVIKNIVNCNVFKGMNYIAYTATPYANVLNETSKTSLYPRDFIVLLEPSKDYMGPKEIFGIEQPEQQSAIDILEDISDMDVEIVRSLQMDEGVEATLPSSFKKAIHWFLLSVSALRSLDYAKPLTMLVHTSFKVDHHQNIASEIQSYLEHFKSNYEEILPQLENQYADATVDFKRTHFLKAMDEYSNPEDIPDYPKWEEVKKNLDRLIRLDQTEYVSHIPLGEEGQPQYHKGIHLVIDNSRAKATDQVVRLVYPDKNQLPNVAPAFIVVGGNTLSRGLTLEGLVSTYFLRTTNQADTLMQMGRWFGYRKGYELFPRVWLDKKALKRYEFLSQMNEEFREEIKIFSQKGSSPRDYAPRVKNSPNNSLIKVTSNNKMQAAIAADFNFAGFNTQTIYFENNRELLQNNLDVTKGFLNNLDIPEINKNVMVWREVKSKDILEFLKYYKVCGQDTKMNALPALVEWVESNSSKLEDWSVIFSSLGDISDTYGKIANDWEIHGYYPKPVIRTKIKKRSDDKTVNIGSLRAPFDLLADVEGDLSKDERKAVKSSDVHAVRKKYDYENVPQLIIYKIDKGEMTESEFIQKYTNAKGENIKDKRAPLNFPCDIIGINLMIPGVIEGNNVTTYVSAKIDIEDQNIEENNYIDKDD